MVERKSNWEEFFDAHAPAYMDNEFTGNTLREVDFLLEELALVPGAAILDVGCGTGRHAVELARRGYAVTGLDLSAAMLAQAALAAQAAGVTVTWVQSDATRFSFDQPFDAVVCLCEGSLGLLGTTDDPIQQPLAILRNIANSLKPRARAIMTVLNGAAMIRRYNDDDVKAGRFDPLLMVESTAMPPRDGLPPIPVRERAFVPTELVTLCGLAGLTVDSMWGGTAGNWGRRQLELDEMEIMVVARKSADPKTFLTTGR